MITGFESITYELTDFEQRVLLPLVIRGWNNRPYAEFEKVGGKLKMTNAKQAVVNMSDMIKGINAQDHVKKKVTGVRLRKVIHYIRMTGQIEHLVASSTGYYKTKNISKLKDFVKSNREKASSFTEIADAIEAQIKNLEVDKT